MFGIGLSKTGTKSLDAALQTLGINSIHLPSPDLMAKGAFQEALGSHDAATDVSVAIWFKELDAAYPGSKFILTTRDMDSWLESCRQHFAHSHEKPEWNSLRCKVFGAAVFDEQLWQKAYFKHHEDVRLHFINRHGDLLVLPLSRYEPTCRAQL